MTQLVPPSTSEEAATVDAVDAADEADVPETPNPATARRNIPITLVQPTNRRPQSRPTKLLRTMRSALRSFPIIAPISCRIATPSLMLNRGASTRDGHLHGATRTTGTLFGHRKARITLAFQENPRSVPHLLLELGVATTKFMQDMSSGQTRVALECEKKATAGAGKSRVLDEPVWTAFVNGRSVGYAARREPTESDLCVMQLLNAVSMGAGVLPEDMTDPTNGELTYMRAHFDRVVGSKDSETFYMLNPEGNTGPELSIFFVRI